MSGIFHSRPRRSLLTGLLVALLVSSPSDALRMFLTLRFTSLLARPGVCLRASLKLNRKSPPESLEVGRSGPLRRALVGAPGLPGHHRPGREEGGPARGLACARSGSGSMLKAPSYLRIFLPSTPQNPVFPPSDPDAETC